MDTEQEQQESQLKMLQELMERQEELDPDLEPYYEEEGALGCPSIRHPLVYSVMHAPGMNAMVNMQLRSKKEALNRAFLAKDWGSYIFLHERPYRLDAFMAINDLMTDEQYWHHLGGIWTDSENIWQNEQDWRIAMTSERPGRAEMMDDEERRVLAEDLQSVVEVHRGFVLDGREEGMSWTKNKVVAKFFARRFARDGQPRYVATGKVHRDNILGYFDGRSEYEIVALPEHVFDLKIMELPHA